MKTFVKVFGPMLVVLCAATLLSGQDIRRAMSTVGTTLKFVPDNAVAVGAVGARPSAVIVGTSGIDTAGRILNSGAADNTASELRLANGNVIFQGGADGIVTLFNAARTDFGRVRLGGTTTGFNAIATSAVGGVPQGIIPTRADGTGQVFANLSGSAAEGSMIYCSDCTFANPCAGVGSGAIAKRLGGVWRCD